MSNHGVPSLQDRIAGAVSDAIATTRPSLAGADPVVRRSERADFQSNAALALATPAAELAEAIHDKAIAAVVQSGPGFLNITVTDQALWHQVESRLADDHLGVGTPEESRRTVVDYSAPTSPRKCT
jgi:arginyl-tRNA synthetase